MKLDLDARIGPLLGILAGNLVVAPITAWMLGEFAWLILVPWLFLADRLGLPVYPFTSAGILAGGFLQGVLYSVILGIACLLDRLGKTVAWLLLVHGVMAAIAIVWRVLAPGPAW